MSREIDERVVQMRFDNAKFEKNINQTIKSLERLNNNLGLENAESGFDNAEKSSKKFEKSINKVSKRFTKFEIIATTALATITNKVVNGGLRMVKALTIDQVSTGWAKYEEQLTTVGGIVNNVKKEFDDLQEANIAVGETMQKLLEYSDETSFSFGTMTNAIKQFTTAGVELNDAANAAVGVSLVAGASKVFEDYKVSSAMEAISKSMQAGYMDLRRWTSLSQTAGIVTTEFSQALMDAAVAEGTLVKNLSGVYATKKGGKQVTTENIASTLSDRWLNKDVMTRVLNVYSEANVAVQKLLDEGLANTASSAIEMIEAMSNTEQINKFGKAISELSITAYKSSQEATTLSQAIQSVGVAVSTRFQTIFQNLIGTTEESTRLWTNIANTLFDVFVPAFDKANEIMRTWHDTYGLVDKDGKKITKFGLVIENIVDIISRFNEAISEAFKSIFNIQEESESGAKAFDKVIDRIIKITDTIKNNEGLFNSITVLAKVFFLVAKTFGKVLGSVLRILGSLLKILSPIIDLVSTGLSYVADLIDDLSILVNDVFGKVSFRWFDTIIDYFEEFLKLIGSEKYVDSFRKSLEKLLGVFSYLGVQFKNVWGIVYNQLNKAKTWLFKMVSDFKSSEFYDIFVVVFNALKQAFEFVKTKVIGVLNTMKGAIDETKTPFENFVNILKSIKEILITGGIILLLMNLTKLFRSISWAFDAIYEYLSSNKLFAIGRMLIGTAGILVALLFIIKEVKNATAGDIVKASSALFVSLASVTGMLATIILVLGRVSENSKKIKVNRILRLGIALSLYVLSVSNLVKNTKGITKTEVLGVFASLITATVGMATVAGLLSVFGGGKIGKLLSTLLTMFLLTRSISTFVTYLRDLASIINENASDIVYALGRLSTIVIALGAFSIALNTLKMITAIFSRGSRFSMILNGGGSLFSLLIGLTAFVLALNGTIKVINSIDASKFESMKKPLRNIFEIIGGILIALSLIGLIPGRSIKQGEKNISNVARTAFAFILVVGALALLFKFIDKVDFATTIKEHWKTLLAIIGISVGLVALMSTFGSKGGKGAILSAISIIMSFVAMVYIVNTVGPEKIESAIGTISALLAVMLIFTVIMSIATKNSNWSKTAAIGEIAVVIGAIIGLMAIILYAKYDNTAWAKFGLFVAITAALTLIIIGIGLLMEQIYSRKITPAKIKRLYSIMATVGVLLLAAIAIMAFILLMPYSNDSWAKFGMFVSMMVVLLGAVFVIKLIAENSKGLDLVPIAVLSATVLVLAIAVIGILKELASINMEEAWEKFKLFAAILGSLVAVAAVLVAINAIPALGEAAEAVAALLIGSIALMAHTISEILHEINAMDGDQLKNIIVSLVDGIAYIGYNVGSIIRGKYGMTALFDAIAGFALSGAAVRSSGKNIQNFAGALKQLVDMLPSIQNVVSALQALHETLNIGAIQDLINSYDFTITVHLNTAPLKEELQSLNVAVSSMLAFNAKNALGDGNEQITITDNSNTATVTNNLTINGASEPSSAYLVSRYFAGMNDSVNALFNRKK